MKYIKLFENYLTVNPQPFANFIPDLYDSDNDAKAIEWAKNQFIHLKFDSIINRETINDVTYLTMVFKSDKGKEYRCLVKYINGKCSFVV